MDYYVVNRSQTIRLPRTATEPVVMELIGAYSPGVQWEIVRDRAESVLIIGEGAPIGREGYDFALNVTPKGVFIEGADDAALTRGLYAFLERLFCYDRGVYRAECGVLRQSPEVGMRVAHLCVFPETPLYFLEKCVRTAAFCRYSHVILEFWGMIRLDSFPQMAWPFAFSKAEISALVRRARALGLEIIPMLQHLGHASMSRQGASGKHVVLDQAPELEYLYLPGFYGWVWDYTKPAVRHLLADIRDELCALCGEGRYFMIGCDEADDLGQGENSLEIARGLCEYLNDIQADLAAKGRRAIMWGDMLLCAADMPLARRADGEYYDANSSHEFAAALRAGLRRDIVIADWQYTIVSDSVWQSARLFREAGFDVICCSFSNQANYQTALNTIRAAGCMGFMKTTWHTLGRQIAHLVYAGDLMWHGREVMSLSKTSSRAMDVFRKMLPCHDYAGAGWSSIQIGPGANILS